MFARISQVARHLSKPLPNYAHNPISNPSIPRASNALMTSPSVAMAAERSKRTIHTAGCIIIGDEVLGGKTVDSNSHFMAQWCFECGITLKKVEVIPDDEEDIIETTRRMSENYDFVVTSGGIGPTHDDITYESIAKGFGLPLVEHAKAFEKMKKLSQAKSGRTKFNYDVPSEALEAKKRMICLPHDENLTDEEQVIFVDPEKLWVPISVVNGNVHILPGVPNLFESLLTSLKPKILHRLVDPEGKGVHRILISTPESESTIAEYLRNLQTKVKPKGIKVGSYPRWQKTRNTVTLVGRDLEYMESLIPEIVAEIKGRRVQVEGEDDDVTPDKDA